MRSTEDFSGVLREEKERLRALAGASGGGWPEGAGTPCWIPYKEARHLEGPMTAFDSSELLPLKERLRALWEGDAAAPCVPIILSAYYKTRDERENYLEKVDLYNYMM